MSAFHCYLSNKLLLNLFGYCRLFSEIVDNSLKGWLLCCKKSGHLTLDICLLLVARQCFTNKKWLPQCASHQSVPPSIFDGTSVTCESWRQSSFYFLLVSRKLKLDRNNSMISHFLLVDHCLATSKRQILRVRWPLFLQHRSQPFRELSTILENRQQ